VLGSRVAPVPFAWSFAPSAGVLGLRSPAFPIACASVPVGKETVRLPHPAGKRAQPSRRCFSVNIL